MKILTRYKTIIIVGLIILAVVVSNLISNHNKEERAKMYAGNQQEEFQGETTEDELEEMTETEFQKKADKLIGNTYEIEPNEFPGTMQTYTFESNDTIYICYWEKTNDGSFMKTGEEYCRYKIKDNFTKIRLTFESSRQICDFEMKTMSIVINENEYSKSGREVHDI